VNYLKILVTKMGDAEIIPDERQDEADFVIVQNNSKEIYRSAQSLNWNEFLGLITKEIDEKFSAEQNESEEKSKKGKKITTQKDKIPTKLEKPPNETVLLQLEKPTGKKEKKRKLYDEEKPARARDNSDGEPETRKKPNKRRSTTKK